MWVCFLFYQDDEHNKKMEIEIKDKQEVPYLTLGEETSERTGPPTVPDDR